eukprot:1991666-Pyramimonas_sp.AAC.1
MSSRPATRTSPGCARTVYIHSGPGPRARQHRPPPPAARGAAPRSATPAGPDRAPPSLAPAAPVASRAANTALISRSAAQANVAQVH